MLDQDNQEEMRRHLVLLPPNAQRRTESLAFKRTREVNIDWDALLAESGPLEETMGVDAIKAFLEQRWQIDVDAPGYPTDADLGSARDSVVRRSPQSMVVTIAAVAQEYTIVAREDSKFADDDFDSRDNYLAFWNKVECIQVPVTTASAVEELDLAGPVILEQYRTLAALRAFAGKISTKADTIFDGQLNAPLTREEIDELLSRFAAMKDPAAEIERRLIRLRDRAADLGYVLNVGEADETFRYPDGDTIVIHPGKLYRPYATVATWHVTHTRRVVETVRVLFWKIPQVRHIPYTVQHARIVTKYKEEIVDLDPWVEKELALAEAGKRSFRFQRLGDRYLTGDGTELHDVLVQCERDKAFWDRCVIWIPIYEQKLTEGEALVRYILISRPLKGVEPTSLPRLFLEEELSIKSGSRTKVELGPLVHTVNLAPREERTITIERSMSREEVTTRTATSLVDLVDTTTTDFATEFENEARNESESTNSSSWNVKASGGWGPFSASAGAGGSSSKTSKQFARDLQRVARKASRNVSRKTKEEISVSSSLKTSVTHRETTSIDFVNNNDGRSLNLAFYQLVNVHPMGVYLEGLRFVVFSGVEDVAGSGLVLPQTFALDELESMLGRLAFGAMPFAERDATDADERLLQRMAYVRVLLLNVIAALREYEPPQNSQNAGGPVTIPQLALIEADVRAFTPTTPDDGAILTTLIGRLTDALSAIIYNGVPLGPDGEQELVVGTAGLYLDSFVGVNPSTEPYAEEMRHREVSLREAQIAEALSRADAHRALTDGGMPPALVIEKVDSDGDHKLTLTFLRAPRAGNWELWVETARSGASFRATGKESDRTYSMTFDTPQAWLKADVKNLCRVVHQTTREACHFLV